MKHLLRITLILILFSSCGPSKKAGITNFDSPKDYGSPNVEQELIDDKTFKIEKYSTDETYGYMKENPIMVGGNMEGPKNERRFLNALAGPNGEFIEYYRMGSCCPFNTKNSEWGGMLDMYNVTYEGLKKEIVLYINMYDSDTLKVPIGFKLWY